MNPIIHFMQVVSCVAFGVHISLIDMQQIISQKYTAKIGWLFAITSLILSSFAIYLGRYLRWNSWDIIINPLQLFYDIGNRVLNPLNYPRAIVVTALFSLFLIIAYLTLKQVIKIHTKHTS